MFNLFRCTVYLFAVEWQVWVDGKWKNNRSHWMNYEEAWNLENDLINAPPDSYIRKVRRIKRPAGRVNFF